MNNNQQQAPKHPVDKGWAWAICFAASMANFYVTGGIRIAGLLFVELIEFFGADNALTSMVMALIAAGFAICSCVGNILGVRFGMRPVAVTGACFSIAGMTLTVAAPSINVALFTLGLMSGIGYGLMFGPSMVLLGQYFKRYASLASGLAVAGGSVGQLALPHFFNYVSDRYAFRGAILLYAGLALHALPAMMLLRPPAFYAQRSNGVASPAVTDGSVERNDKKELSSGKQRVTGDAVEDGDALFKDDDGPQLNGLRSESFSRPSRTRYWLMDGSLVERRISVFLQDSTGRPSVSLLAESVQDIRRELEEQLQQQKMREEKAANPPPVSGLRLFCRKCCDPGLVSNPLFILFVLGLSFGHGGFVSTCIFIPPYSYELWSSKLLIAVLLSVVGVCDLVGRIAGGMVAGLNVVNKPLLIGGSFLISGISTLVMPFLPNKPVFFVYTAVLGLLGGTYMAQMIVLIVELFGPALLAPGLGLSTLFMGLFVIPVPPLLGAAQKKLGTFSASMRLSGLLLVFGGLFYCAIPLIQRRQRRARGKQEEEERAEQSSENDEQEDTTTERPLRQTLPLLSEMDEETNNLNSNNQGPLVNQGPRLNKGRFDWTRLGDVKESNI